MRGLLLYRIAPGRSRASGISTRGRFGGDGGHRVASESLAQARSDLNACEPGRRHSASSASFRRGTPAPMPLVKVSRRAGFLAAENQRLLDAVHEALVEAFKIPDWRPPPAAAGVGRGVLRDSGGARGRFHAGGNRRVFRGARARPSVRSTRRWPGDARRRVFPRVTYSWSCSSHPSKTGARVTDSRRPTASLASSSTCSRTRL